MGSWRIRYGDKNGCVLIILTNTRHHKRGIQWLKEELDFKLFQIFVYYSKS